MNRHQANHHPEKWVPVTSPRSRAPSDKSKSAATYVRVATDVLCRIRHLSIDSMVTQLKTLSRQLGSMQVDDN
jgi:hypothetical protein